MRRASLCLSLSALAGLGLPFGLSAGCSSSSSPTAAASGAPTTAMMMPTASGSGAMSAAPTSSVPLTVEAWAVDLLPGYYGPDRLAAVQAAVAGATSDVLCLQTVFSDDDKASIAAAAAAHFPNAVYAKTTWDTPYDDDADQSGATPAYETTGPCSLPDDAANLDALVKCLATSCSSNPGSEDGYITGEKCFTSHCASEGLAVISGSDPRSRCGECLVATSSSEKLSQMRVDCASNPNARLLFKGQSGAMLLSALPLASQETRVVGSTRYRDVFLQATVGLPMNAVADVYCAGLVTIPPDSLLGTYTGFYGRGLHGSAAWASEQLLQARKLLAYVTQKTGSGRAVIGGYFSAGPGGVADGGVTLEQGAGKGTWDFLSMSFAPGTSAAFGLSCTECPDNPSSAYAGDPTMRGNLYENLLLFGLSQGAVQSTDRTHTDKVLMNGQDQPGAVSGSYGLRSVIAVPAPLLALAGGRGGGPARRSLAGRVTGRCG